MFLIIFCAGFLSKKTKPPSLVSLCVGVIGRHLEDIIVDLSEIAVNLPADIKVGYWKMNLLIGHFYPDAHTCVKLWCAQCKCVHIFGYVVYST